MLTFLNYAILSGLAAAAIPILIHLFARKKIKTVYFSSLKFLKELQKQKIRRLKIRQILLLILRTLMILFLVLAFARPALKSTKSATLESGAKLTAVIILDNTLSMGGESQGRRLLDRAKERALEILNLMRLGDEIYLLYPQEPPVFAHEGPRYNLESLRELIENTELSYSKTDYVSSLIIANEIMNKSNNINQEIYLICDMQKNGLKLANNGNGGIVLNKSVKFFLLPITEVDGENLNILDVRFGNQILEKGKVIELETEIRNNSEKSLKDKLVHLFINGKRVGQRAVDLEGNSSTRVLFRMIPEQTGLQSGFVMLEDDALLEDNRRYLTFNILHEIPVLLVGGHKADTHYLKLALHPEKDATTYIKIKEVLYNDLVERNLDEYPVVILSNVPQFNNVIALKLKRYLAGGGGLIVFLGPDVNLRNYNEFIHKNLKLPLLSESIRNLGDDQFIALGKIDYSHPIFRDVFEEERKKVESPHLRFVVSITSESPLDKIIEYSTGLPFLFESQFQQGRIMYFTTGLSEEWSNLTLRGIFVPLINRCVTYLAGGTSEEKDEILIGEEIAFYLDRKDMSTELSMEKPDGTQIKIKPEVFKGKYFIRFQDTDQPGIYTLNSGVKKVAQWTVNYDPTELESEYFETAELKSLMRGGQVFEIKTAGNIAEKLKESRFGKELWKYLIAVTLVLLVVEMFIMREKAEVPEKSTKLQAPKNK